MTPDNAKPETNRNLEYALLERALAASKDGILITDNTQPDNPIVWCNPGFLNMTGYKTEEVLGHNCRFLQGKETDRKTVSQLREAIQAGRNCAVKILNYTREGTAFWNELHISPVHDAQGVLTHFVGIQHISQDTDSADVDQVLEYAANIVDTVREPLIILDDELRVVSANLSFYRFFQVSPTETLGNRIYDLGDAQWNITALKQLLHEILPNQTSLQDFEVTHDFPRIGKRTMLLNALQVGSDADKPQRILLAMEDITHHTKTLEASVEFVRGIVNAIGTHVAILDATGKVVAVNAAWSDFPCSPNIVRAAVQGSNYLTLCDTDTGEESIHSSRMAEGIRNILAKEQATFEYEYSCIAGTEVLWFLARVHPFDYAGQRYLVITQENITASRRYRQSIEQLNERLRRAMTETHHRVKNNLQVLSAVIDLQAQEQSDPIRQIQFKRLNSYVQTMASIHTILTFEARKDGRADTLPVQSLIEQILPMLQALFPERQLKSDIQSTVLSSAQGTSLALLVNELVLNAFKYGEGDVEIRFEIDGEEAMLTVQDSGPGFPPDFDPELNANAGLELVQSMGKWDLGGQLLFENRSEQQGAQVTVRFPINSPTAASSLPAVSAPLDTNESI